MDEAVNLPPDSILQVAMETEEKIWSQGGITDDRETSLHYDPNDVGVAMLKHGTSTKRIHHYFIGLEQRKCCLLLAACKKTFTSVRLVRNDGRDSGIEEGAMMKSNIDTNDTVPGLDAVEFQVFKNALKCAAFPVLGAPDPPAESTPIPYVKSPSHKLRGMSLKKDNGDSLLQIRDVSPASMHDSGVEEQEDSGLVPMETLCELLRRAFKLSAEKFSHYEKIVIAHIDKKSPQKVLAEELGLQLIALENNENPYYNPKSFLNRNGYDHWQQRERQHISELLNKFWHFSLPAPSDRSAKMTVLHKQYRQLLEKLISYESPYRQQNELIAPPPTSPLSTASVRLLREFGLRYGVGEQYRKIVYLNYLALNFDPTVWFIHHVMISLTSVMEAMPTKRSFLVIVKEEFSVLEETLQLLEAKSSAAISKMKTLYNHPTMRPLDGVEPLIELLSLTLKSKRYLLMSPEEQLGTRLYKIAQATFPTAYERHKMVAQEELRHNKWDAELSPKLLNMLIGHIRDEVQDYKQNYQTAFQKYFNITVEAAQEFYKLLMVDVTELLKQTKTQQTMSLEINKLMLSLAYRLHQLDQDWNHYITPQMQTWREMFLVEAQHWSIVLKLDMQKFITRAVALDRYPVCDLHWTGSLQSSSGGEQRHRTLTKSITPSFNSAFTSPSSHQSTPLMQSERTVPEESPSLSPEIHKAPEFPVDFDANTSNDHLSSQDQRACSDPVNISHSSVLKGTYIGEVARSLGHCNEESLLSFAKLQHSSSMPNISDRVNFIERMTESGRRSGSSLDMPGSISPEFTGLTINAIAQDTDSDTLTDESHDSVSHNGDFSFPPLKEIGSSAFVPYSGQSSNKKSEQVEGVKLVKPISSKGDKQVKLDSTSDKNNKHTPQAQNIEIHAEVHSYGEILHPKPGPSRSKQTSGRPQKAEIRDEIDFHQDSFTNSLGSAVSFPHPSLSNDYSLAVLPISSSAMDVLIILQRIVGLGKVLCRTLTPSCHGYESSNQSVASSSHEEEFHIPPTFIKPRKKLFESFLSAIKHSIIVYADNMLCMDLCGTTQAVARRLAGRRLIEYLQTQQKSGLIWGCRHDLLAKKDCFHFLNKTTKFLCDRHEPITREMCVRINNVMFMSSCLDWYYRYLGNMFGVYEDLSVRRHRVDSQLSAGSADMVRGDFIVVESYDYDPAVDSSEVMETASQLCPSIHSEDSCRHIVVTSQVDADKDHLMALARAMCRIMAYRLNLFVQDALPVLLTLKGPHVPIETGLGPLTDFLSNYSSVLKGWLYKDSYRRVLECLWIFIVQDFEQELQKIEHSDIDNMYQGQLLLQALAHLLKFMNNQHESLRRELLLSQAADVSFKLSLYAMPIQQLAAIYRGLCKEAVRSETSSIDSQYQSVLVVRQRLKHDLQTYRKGFSGSELVTWILNNLDLFSSFDPGLSESHVMYSKEKARNIAQRLLDWRVITDIEGETMVGRGSPTASVMSFEFPDMTIHAQMPAQTNRLFSKDSDEEHTPQATPRATPKPGGLRASIRALSRQKMGTPGFTGAGERSTFNQSLRSQISSQTDSNRSAVKGASNVMGNVTVRSDPGAESGYTDRDDQSLESDLGDKFVFTGPQGDFYGRQGSESDLPDFDPYLGVSRGSPNSLASGISCESRSAIFFESSETFYSVCPYIGDEHKLNWKNYELLNLVEECFQRKVTEDYVLRIIYSRRKTDPRVKRFMQSPQVKSRELIRFGATSEEVSVCASS